MRNISIDIETYSSRSLQKCGVYKYAESHDFEILLFGYSVDGGPVRTVDLACGEEIPAEVISALTDDEVLKWAFNAQFERVCLSRFLHDQGISLDPFHDTHPLSTEAARYLNPGAWRCSMVWSAYMGLPLSLEGAGAVLGLEKQKLSEGKDLIRYFSVPCKPTKTNGGRTRNLPEHDPEKWERYKAYNVRDVETEMQIQEAFDKLMEGRTSFVVAHRLSTIRAASVILVMRDGKIMRDDHGEGGKKTTEQVSQLVKEALA